MIDVTVVDAWFEASKDVLGGPVRFAVFDRNALLSLDQLWSAVTSETGETCTVELLQKKAAEGWFPLVPRPGTPDELGAPLYVPSRVGLFVRLEREGWSNAELRLAAYLEEATIDAVTTDTDYSDDDLEVLEAHLADRVEGLKGSKRWDKDGNPVDLTPEIAEDEKILAVVRKWRRDGLPERRREDVAKYAYRVRAQNDIVTLMMVEGDRAKLRAGYSPTVHFREHQIGPDATFDPAQIDWDWTIRHASAQADPPTPPLVRVDGFVLNGDKVVSTRTMTPREYGAAWERQRVEDYLHTWARLQGEKRCLHCLAPLPPDAKDSRRFCNDRCRTAEKMKRHRRENPESVLRAQERYWKS
ncbi:hypothetical protein [Anaeromyxobacter dehalogenans]|uniref:Uncharacterized protein n=1 Tax=Anaeromyxobacter dehalogenans (strain 2CP-C) TaxID=290397 RepID=Q2IEL5_ANADE|nr:hypothetical protein [Anaeromyxobacter dehalogenans]ABC83026.1 hypothetical protein Adeh_3258 [Anaeromyxobacter dehalogenans 2CP-C]